MKTNLLVFILLILISFSKENVDTPPATNNTSNPARIVTTPKNNTQTVTFLLS